MEPITFEAMLAINRVHVITRPGLFSKLLLLLSSDSITMHGYPAKQIVACPVTLMNRSV